MSNDYEVRITQKTARYHCRRMACKAYEICADSNWQHCQQWHDEIAENVAKPLRFRAERKNKRWRVVADIDGVEMKIFSGR